MELKAGNLLALQLRSVKKDEVGGLSLNEGTFFILSVLNKTGDDVCPLLFPLSPSKDLVRGCLEVAPDLRHSYKFSVLRKAWLFYSQAFLWCEVLIRVALSFRIES